MPGEELGGRGRWGGGGEASHVRIPTVQWAVVYGRADGGFLLISSPPPSILFGGTKRSCTYDEYNKLRKSSEEA